MTREEAISRVAKVFNSSFAGQHVISNEHRNFVGALEVLGLLQFKPPDNVELKPEDVLANMRRCGWRVGVHNDYRVNGHFMTFWLMVHPNGAYVKGEAATDLAALRICETAAFALSACHNGVG
jgi:hypothetical protein